MATYRGPRIRIIRRLGLLPGLTRKNTKNRTKTPGQHGRIVFTRTKRSSLSDDYKERLFEKQKLRFNYGVSEKQLVAYFKEAKRKQGSTGTGLLELLESSEKFIPIGLHGDLADDEQELAFMPTPSDKVKVVIATNIAESSLTIPDVDMVICLGSHKSMY